MFVFWGFCFCWCTKDVVMKVKVFKSFVKRGMLRSKPEILSTSLVQIERLMCEVEFWEVFYGKNEGF